MKHIVTIGGGTGSFAVLSGLKKHPVKLSAIVSTADSGGSSEILRDELGVLPPGDIRQCLAALSDADGSVRELLNYRFKKGSLRGHTFGNIFISCLEEDKGNIEDAILEASRIFNVKGDIIPVSKTSTNLFLRLGNGRVLTGEHAVDISRIIKKCGVRKIYLKPRAKANKKALEAIQSANLIVICPGDPYSSILPNLLAGGIVRALEKTKAKLAYVSNIMTKKGQTDDFSVADFVSLIEKYLGMRRFDYVVYNTQKPDSEFLKKYKQEGSAVGYEKRTLSLLSAKTIGRDLLYGKVYKSSKSDMLKRSLFRHDTDKLAKVIVRLV